MTIKEAAEILRCSEQHVKRMAQAGKLDKMNIGLGKQQVLRVALRPQEKTSSSKQKFHHRKLTIPPRR